MDLTIALLLLGILATVVGHVIAFLQRRRQIRLTEERLDLALKREEQRKAGVNGTTNS